MQQNNAMQQMPVITEQMLPPHLRPLSMWSYFGHALLYAIPFVGFIVLIVQALGASNVNLRNYARSYFCGLIIVVVAFLIMIGCGLGTVLTGFLLSR